MATGPGIVDRSLFERLGVLLGDRGNKDMTAVRRGELTDLVVKVIERREKEMSEASAKFDDPGDDDAPRIETFQPDRVTGNFDAGFYAWGGATSWRPPVGVGGGAVYVPRNDQTGMWLAAASWGGRGNNIPRAFLKNGSGTIDDFGAWREVYHEANVVGPVQIGPDGFPIGAVIESNVTDPGAANGRYIRFADGTQIVRFGPAVSGLAIGTSYYGGFRSAYQDWNFLVPFASTPQVIPACQDSFGATLGTVTATSAQFAATAITSQAAATRQFGLVAVGRWL